MRYYTAIIFSIFLAIPALEAKVYGDFENVEYVDNYDGDTITFNIPGVHPLIGEKIRIRLRNVDTPELKGKCIREQRMAKSARDFVRLILSDAKPGDIKLINVERGKYFRLLADVMVKGLGMSLSDYLVRHKFAKIYTKDGKTYNWCDGAK
jgi:endonuclease YncB( thermonuclease family)